MNIKINNQEIGTCGHAPSATAVAGQSPHRIAWRVCGEIMGDAAYRSATAEEAAEMLINCIATADGGNNGISRIWHEGQPAPKNWPHPAINPF